MRKFIIKWFINTVALMIVVHVLSGIEAANWTVVLIAALLLGLFNAFLKPFIVFVTLPINILSLGAFTFFINAFLFYIVAKIVKGFFIAGFWSAFWGALLFSIISFMLNLFTKTSLSASAFTTSPKPPAGSPRVIDAEVVKTHPEEKK